MQYLFLLLLFFFLISCGGADNSEQKEYDSMCSGLKFKSYKTLSENTIPPILLVYNSTAHEDELKVSEGILRILIGYSWAITDKPEYAIAESKIIQDISSQDADQEALTHALKALAMYEKGWKTMAGNESQETTAALNKMPTGKSTEMKKVAYHLLLGTLCIYEKNYQGARFHFAAFNTVTKIEWPYLICDAMADIHEGNISQALIKIKKIIDNTDVPVDVSTSLSEILKTVDINAKEIDPQIFWTKAISQSVYNSIKHASIEGIDKISGLMENIQKKLSIE